jgi:hypothetical protein
MKLTVQIGWICLAIVSLAILVFGVVVAVGPMGGTLLCIVRTVSPRPDWAFSAR